MIRHRNYYAMVQSAIEMDDRLTLPGDVMLLYLPLAHNYGRLLHLSAAYIGFTIAFLPDPLRAATELPRVRPHAVPERARASTRRSTPPSSRGFDEHDGREARDRRLGARASAAASRALRQARQAGARGARRCSTGSPTGSSTRR